MLLSLPGRGHVGALRPLSTGLLLLLSAVLAVIASGSGAQRSQELAAEAMKLRPQSDLTSGCLNFPAENFDRKNSIEGVYGSTPKLFLKEGESAIDFTLHDTDGQPWNLRDALEGGDGKPVVLVWGMFTCPAFQGMGTSYPWEKCGYSDEYAMVETHKDKATFVHLYVAEPHPNTPYTNFDSGKVNPQYWSVVKQPFTYQDRLEMAAKIQHLIHPDQVHLPEYLPGNPYSDLVQPVWCSYALGARPAVVISPEGVVMFQQEWLQTDHIGAVIDKFWALRDK